MKIFNINKIIIKLIKFQIMLKIMLISMKLNNNKIFKIKIKFKIIRNWYKNHK